MKILIVGHDAHLAALTGKILERSGYDTVCCSCIAEISELFESKNIGLVIADMEAEESERIQFCKMVKGINKPPKLLFIGRSSDEEIPMLNAGADDWIRKPYKTDVFIARISALMRQRKNIL